MDRFNLDEHIKKALENFQVSFQENHWELFEQELNAPTNADLSENLDDHIVREKLSNLSPQADPTHWEALAAKMAAVSVDPIMEDALVDGVAYENLHDLNPSYEEAHWDLMEEKIDNELGWQNKVVRYKVVELSLVLLFLFTFMQNWPNAKVIIPKLIEKFPAEQKAQPKVEAEKATKSAENLNTEPIAANESFNLIETDGVDGTNTTTTTTSHGNILTSSKGLFTPLSENKGVGKNIEGDRSDVKIVRDVQTIPLMNNLSSEVVIMDEQEISEPADEVDANYEFSSFAMLASLDEGLLEELDFSLPDCNDCLKSKSPSYLRIGIKGIGNMDFYSTQMAPESSLNRETQFVALDTVRPYEYGYGGGLTIGVRKDRWEFETGLFYSTKEINPDSIYLLVDRGSLLSGFKGTGWMGSELDLLQIPINIRYDFLNKSKWKVYAQSGMTFNMALNSIDRYQEVLIEPQNIRGLEEQFEDTRIAIASTNNEGISQGGSFSQNSFFNLDVGFGLERSFSTRYSAFIQTNYHHFLGVNGLKNTGLDLNSISIQTGFKVSLKKRDIKSDSHRHSNNLNAGGYLRLK